MENTRARILTAAAQLFEQQGYRSVSMRAIAAQLGISVGNLTYHFPHKQDIATALAEQELTAIILPEEATLPALTRCCSRTCRGANRKMQTASRACSRIWNGC